MDLYGGIYFDNLVKGPGDPYYALQIQLFEEGRICGVQAVVNHPSRTLEITRKNLEERLKHLPSGFKVYIHLGAESSGVDPGERFDEFETFAKDGAGYSWSDWNKETLQWGKFVAETLTKMGHGTGLENDIIGSTHPGYGWAIDDLEARERSVKTFQELGATIGLENVPPAVDAYFWKLYRQTKVKWPLRYYWGFGGTPEDMENLLKEIGPGTLCLLDFTHINAMSNQARHPIAKYRVPEYLADIKNAVDAYMELPHSKVCHYSGFQGNYPHDSHDFVHVPPPKCIVQAMQNMEAVCLELRWNPANYSGAIQTIEDFHKIIG